MNKINIITLLLCMSSTAFAQNIVTVDEGEGKTEDIELPEGMILSEDELMDDYVNKENLKPSNRSNVRDLSYDDSIIVSRLSRIPTTIEMPLNNVTRKFIDTYSNKMKRSVAVMLGSSNFYMPIFEEALERYGLPLELKYLPVIESALRPSATSRVGAAGLWQFMINTGKKYGLEINTLVDERRDPVKASDAAARYLRDLYGMFGDWGLAIAAYNCGEGNVQRAILRAGKTDNADYWNVYGRLPRETRGYVPAFIAANYIMNYYCEHGISPYETTLPQESDTVVVGSEMKFSQIAAVCDVTIDELRAINPQYRRDIIPSGYVLRLPSSVIENFVENEGAIASTVTNDGGIRRATTEDVVEIHQSIKSKRNSRRGRSVTTTSSKGGTYVEIRNGDTLSELARRYHTTVKNLQKLNNKSDTKLRAGKKIRVN